MTDLCIPSRPCAFAVKRTLTNSIITLCYFADAYENPYHLYLIFYTNCIYEKVTRKTNICRPIADLHPT